MLKKCLALMLAVFSFHTSVGLVWGSQQGKKPAPSAEEVRKSVLRRGLGMKARVKVKLRNGKELKGYITQVEEEYFVIADEKAGTLTRVTYDDVEHIKDWRKGLSTLHKVLIVWGVLTILGGIANPEWKR